MLTCAEIKSISTIVPMTRVSDIDSEEHHFIEQMPQQVTFGHLTLTNDQEEFLQGFNSGMESNYELDYEKRQMTAQALRNDLLETILDEETPLIWRVGFIFSVR
jgi:hypothetical protein